MAGDKTLLALLCVALLVVTAAAGCGRSSRGATESSPARTRSATGKEPVRVRFSPRVVDVHHSTSISVSGVKARRAEVRLLGATDRAGIAYEWTPYPWRRLRLSDGTWQGVLPPPALPGIYEVQLRLDHGRKLLSSGRWLLRVFPHGTSRRTFTTAAAAVRDFVLRLPGDEVLVALRRWPMAAFDHRDRRLHELFVIAYAPLGDRRLSSRLGMFVTTVRDGFHGRWQLLAAADTPYG